MRAAIVFTSLCRLARTIRTLATGGRVLFFRKRRKKNSVFKNIRIHVNGALKYGVYKMKFKIYLSKQNDLSKAEVDILLLGSLITDNNIFNIPLVKHTHKNI